MLMKEAREQSGLTRKAIEYYEEKGLISPEKLENGYRCYSPHDVTMLKRITLYRGLGLSLEETRQVLAGKAALGTCLRQRQLDARRDSLRAALLKRLAHEGESPDILAQAEALFREEDISRRLAHALPGYLGQAVMIAFAPYLREPCATPDQEAAFQALISFLDDLPPLVLPDDLARALEEMTLDIPLDMLEEIQQKKLEALDDTAKWADSNQKTLRQYMAFKASSAYQNSPIAKIHALTRAYFAQTGFYDNALPLIRRISPAYDAYQQQLRSANEILLQKMPELSENS